MSMSPWSHFPFARIILALVGGLLASHYWEGSIWIISALLGVFLLFYILVIVVTAPTSFPIWSPWLGILGLGSIFLLGYLRGLMHEVRLDPAHITHWPASVEAYEALALEDTHEKTSSRNLIVDICKARMQGQWKHVQGKVQLFLPKSAALTVRYGDALLIKGTPCVVPGAKNPYEFDQAAFLGLSQVYHQHFVQEDEVVVMGHRPANPIKVLSFRVLRYCQALFTRYIHHAEARAVVLALVLGQKDALNTEVKTAYARSGTMHVLAVSGLHVGILYWFLNLFLGLLKSMGKIRRFSSVVALIVIWLYAFVTGLSPSVLRAATMFTFVAVASVLGRQPNIYNTLAASAFLLLFWDPMLLFSVGFQLSYLAVLGIVYLQPRVYRVLVLDNWILNKLWLLASVSIGAQVATTPLSLYYFNQFPTYFVVANWIVVPAALVILCLGLITLMVSFWPGLSVLSTWLLETVVLGINTFVNSIQTLPYSLIGPVYLSTSMVLLLYGLMIFCCVFLHTKKIEYLIFFSVLVVLLSLHSIRVCLSRQAQCKVIFYSIDRHQVIAFVKGSHSMLCVDSRFKVDAPKYIYHIQPSYTALGIISSDTYMLEEAVQHPGVPIQEWHGLKVAVWQGKKFIFIDKNIAKLPRFVKKIPVDFLVVEKNAVTMLASLRDHFEVGTLIIGAANQKKLVYKLQKEALKCGLHSHALHHQGAFVTSW